MLYDSFGGPLQLGVVLAIQMFIAIHHVQKIGHSMRAMHASCKHVRGLSMRG